MRKRIAALVSVLSFALVVNATASTANSGWVLLYYGAGDNNLSHFLVDNVNRLADVGSGYVPSTGHYFTILALLDPVGAQDSGYYWVFLRNFDHDWDYQYNKGPVTGLVDMDRVLYWNDGTADGLDVYLDEILLDLNGDGLYFKKDDACVWPGQDGVFECPDGTDFEDEGLVADLNDLVGTFVVDSYDVIELDTGRPGTMSAFFQNSKNKFQDYWKYCIMFQQDHGSVQVGSWDLHDVDGSSICRHINAIEEDELVHETSIYQLHVIFYDQCLRATMDSIYEVADVNENGCPFYAVASELLMWLPGINYVEAAEWLRDNPSDDPEDAAIEMAYIASTSMAEPATRPAYDTVSAFAVNRVAAYGTGDDIKDMAADIDSMAQQLNAVRVPEAYNIRGAVDDSYEYYDLYEHCYNYDLKRFIDALGNRIDPQYTALHASLDDISSELIPNTQNVCLVSYIKPNYTRFTGFATYSPLYSVKDLEARGLPDGVDNERPPYDIWGNWQQPGYWCWVFHNQYYGWDGGSLPRSSQPLFYYDSTADVGQTAYQLADYAKDATEWCEFLREADLRPLHGNPSYYVPGYWSTGVSIATDVYLTFQEEIDTGYGSVTVRKVSNGQSVSGSLSRYNVVIGGVTCGRFKFDPTYSLQTYTQYEVVVGADFRDTEGLCLDGNNDQYGSQTPADQIVWRFTTGGC